MIIIVVNSSRDGYRRRGKYCIIAVFHVNLEKKKKFIMSSAINRSDLNAPNVVNLMISVTRFTTVAGIYRPALFSSHVGFSQHFKFKCIFQNVRLKLKNVDSDRNRFFLFFVYSNLSSRTDT